MTPSGRAIGTVPPGWGVLGRLAIPPGGGALVLPSGAAAVAEPVSPTLEAFVVHAVESRRVTLDLAPAGRSSASSAATARRWRSTTATTELRPRLAEILALLCANPNGMSADTLCADLHGDGGSVSSVRVEVSRLRKLLGPWIDTDRYRLTCDVETDVRRIEGLLAAGACARRPRPTPARCCPTPRRPACERERERLDTWLRQAVMTADDAEALWAWVHTPTGEDDLGAWKRLLTQLEFRDPRRSLCAARVGELRRAALM